MSPREAGEGRIELYDPSTAALLAIGKECGGEGGKCHAFECARGNGTLLTYYFGKGRREVMVRFGPQEGVSAVLGTRWTANRREWTLEL